MTTPKWPEVELIRNKDGGDPQLLSRVWMEAPTEYDETETYVPKHQLDRLEGELAFALRFLMDRREEDALRGASAGAMVVAAIRGGDPLAVPHDLDDLVRCDRAYRAAPPSLQERMLPILEQHRAALRTDPNDPSPSDTEKRGTGHGGACDDKAVRELTQLREALGGDEAKAAVVDFLDAWRFCPVSNRSKATTESVRQCLEDAASQLLASLLAALATKEEGS